MDENNERLLWVLVLSTVCAGCNWQWLLNGTHAIRMAFANRGDSRAYIRENRRIRLHRVSTRSRITTPNMKHFVRMDSSIFESVPHCHLAHPLVSEKNEMLDPFASFNAELFPRKRVTYCPQLFPKPTHAYLCILLLLLVRHYRCRSSILSYSFASSQRVSYVFITFGICWLIKCFYFSFAVSPFLRTTPAPFSLSYLGVLGSLHLLETKSTWCPDVEE